MMNGYGPGWAWMMLMPLLWVALIAVVVWAVIRLVQRPSSWQGGPGPQGRETPQEILDRRFARVTSTRRSTGRREPTWPGGNRARHDVAVR
jgi:putative membrane protein